MLGVPFAVLSIPTSSAYAKGFDSFEFFPETKETISKWNAIGDAISDIIYYFTHLNEHIARSSIEFLTWSFDLITNVVLNTPSVIFSSQWFSSNILMFTGMSIGMSIILAMIEGFKRMMNKSHTKMDRISRRLPFVILGAGLAPLGFSYAFKFINKFTDMIIGIGRAQMTNGIENFAFNDTTLLEMFAFIGFDLALVGMMVPVFLQNFRRWFDLLALGVMTPMALSCWMFKSHEHYFKTWWEHVKKCSLVQLVYAVFLLLIGSLMFGAKEPDNEAELLIKMGIVIGGLWRMANPPNFLRRHLDTGANAIDMWKGAGNAITPGRNFVKSAKKAFNILRGKVVK